jgi:chromosome segregation ATPase
MAAVFVFHGEKIMKKICFCAVFMFGVLSGINDPNLATVLQETVELKQRIASLEDQVETHNLENSSLPQKLEELKQTVTSLKSQLETLNLENSSLPQKLEELKLILTRLQEMIKQQKSNESLFTCSHGDVYDVD